MNTEFVTETAMTQVDIDRLVRDAQVMRAEAMHVAIADMVNLFKRLAGYLRPSRQRIPQTGAWA